MTDITGLVKLWEEDTTSLYEGRPRSQIPEMPMVGDAIQVTRGGDAPGLAYLACIIRDTDSKLTVIRAIASAVAILFGESSNFTGSPKPPDELTGLDVLTKDDVNASAELKTSFEGAPPLTLADVDPYMDCDPDELGGYFGVLFLAGTKRLTNQNATAFNEKRTNTIKSASAKMPMIFVPGSAFLDETVLNKVYASFTSMAAIRAQLINRVALKMNQIRYGPVVTFSAMFLLLVDSGMGTLKIIKEASLKCPWVKSEFPELKAELEAADKGQRAIRAADPPIRPFVKAIFGAAFVPVAQADVVNLLGVAKKIMSHYTASYRQFGGGRTTPQQDAKIAEKLGLRAEQLAEETI